jgi:hypothetical protein
LNLVSVVNELGNPALLEPPNPVRKAYYDIKFDSVWASNGTIGIDSAFIRDTIRWSINRLLFIDPKGREIKPNFVKGTITVQAEEFPCGAARLDLRENRVLELADVVLMLNCIFSGKGDCKENFTAADVVILMNAIFLGAAPPPPPTC